MIMQFTSNPAAQSPTLLTRPGAVQARVPTTAMSPKILSHGNRSPVMQQRPAPLQFSPVHANRRSPVNAQDRAPWNGHNVGIAAAQRNSAPPPQVLPAAVKPSYSQPSTASPAQGSPALMTPSVPGVSPAQRSYRSRSAGPLSDKQPVSLVDKIIGYLRDRVELKEHVAAIFDSISSRGKHLDLTGLRHFRARLTQALGIPDQAFGDLMVDYVRFDFDGNGMLELNEVYKLVKFHLWEYSKKIGGSSAQISIPFKSVAEAGYVISRELGKGNQGVITLATDSTGTKRCIKSYKKSSLTMHGLDMLKEEFEAMKLVGCERLAQTFEIFQDSQCFYMVNEVYYGGDFQTLRTRAIAQDVDMDEDWWRIIVRQCLRALDFMHQQAMIHCDIKEPNMMLKTEDFHNPEVVLIDFGLSKAMGAGEAGTWGGTFGYIPPETHEQKKWFPRGDIFSLGVVFFQIITDTIPDPEIRLPVEKGLFLRGCRTLDEVRQVTATRVPPLHMLSEYPGLMDLTSHLLEKTLARRLRAPVALAHEWVVTRPQGKLHRSVSKPLRSKHRMATPGIIDTNALNLQDMEESEDDSEETSMSQPTKIESSHLGVDVSLGMAHHEQEDGHGMMADFNAEESAPMQSVVNSKWASMETTILGSRAGSHEQRRDPRYETYLIEDAADDENVDYTKASSMDHASLRLQEGSDDQRQDVVLAGTILLEELAHGKLIGNIRPASLDSAWLNSGEDMHEQAQDAAIGASFVVQSPHEETSHVENADVVAKPSSLIDVKPAYAQVRPSMPLSEANGQRQCIAPKVAQVSFGRQSTIAATACVARGGSPHCLKPLGRTSPALGATRVASPTLRRAANVRSPTTSGAMVSRQVFSPPLRLQSTSMRPVSSGTAHGRVR